MMEAKNSHEKIELTWYEKKQGIKAYTKAKKVKGKEERRKRRAEEQENADAPKSRAKAAADTPHAVRRHAKLSARKVDALFSIKSLPDDAKNVLLNFDSIIESNHPLNSKQRALLPGQIRALSHTLTDERDERRVGYMNQTTTLSAYVHYYLWWNIFRLTRLFSNLPPSFFTITDGSICLDIGSGPLTVVIALFMARPELRGKKLTWYCMDISPQALAIGEDIFLSVAAKLQSEPWKIIRVKGALGASIKEKAQLVTCANAFNEIVQVSDMPPDYLAKKYAEQLLSYADADNDITKILVVEPGVPSCARFISLLRDALIRRDFLPYSPCPHTALEQCPMDGKREGKWCNYVFTTEAAPRELKKLSDSAHLAKERAVLSFIAAGKTPPQQTGCTFRIASDPIRLPGNRTGYYACSAQGLLLIVTHAPFKSGECYSVDLPYDVTQRKDRKSGAYVIELD